PATTPQAPANGAPSPLPGLAAPSTNPLLEATQPRADAAPNAATSAALAAAEAVRQAAGGAPATPATTSSQAMIEALAARQQSPGGNAQEAPLLAGGSAPGGQGTLPLTPSTSPGSLAATAQQASLSAPVGSQSWPRQLGQQLLQFARQGGEQRIEMRLHPAELGPLSVTLKVGDQGAQAHFLSAHGQVRHALEQAIPQLREALAEQGISLGETSVGEQRQGGTEGEGRRFADAAAGTSGGEGDSSAETVTPAAVPGSMILDGRVDLYA
ncbi:flagellar hook-length control protein FliK, partial [Halomonas salina]